MSVVKIFALTRAVHAPRPYGQPDGCPIPLSCGIALNLNKIEHFSKVLVLNYFRFMCMLYRNRILKALISFFTLMLHEN